MEPDEHGHSRRTPQLSIVIPLFNKARDVERAVLAVLAQDTRSFEVLVVDDGSTDTSASVVDCIQDSRLRIVRQPNLGESAARNRGVSEAVGDLIAFCDADDEWTPDFLSTIVRLERSFPECSVFGTGYLMREPNGRKVRQIINGLPTADWEGVIEDYFYVASRSDGPLCMSSFAARREALLATGGFPAGIKIGGDLLALARLATEFPVAFSPAPKAIFSLRGAYPSRPVRMPDTPDVVGLELACMERHARRPQQPSMRRYVALWHRMRGVIYTYHGLRSQALTEFWKALRRTPGDARLYALAVVALLPRSFREDALSKIGSRKAQQRQ